MTVDLHVASWVTTVEAKSGYGFWIGKLKNASWMLWLHWTVIINRLCLTFSSPCDPNRVQGRSQEYLDLIVETNASQSSEEN